MSEKEVLKHVPRNATELARFDERNKVVKYIEELETEVEKRKEEYSKDDVIGLLEKFKERFNYVS